MASPVVEGVAESATATAGTSHTIALPASTGPNDYVLLLVDAGSVGGTFNALTDWTETLDESVANGLKIIRYTGTGVPSDPTFTSSASIRTASLAFRISGTRRSVAPVIGTTASGTSATPDPPQVGAPSTSTDCLFIAFHGRAGEEADDDTWVTSSPTSYTPSPPYQKACGTAGTNLGGMIAAAYRQLTTSSVENPATFSGVSAAWRAQTIRIDPTPPLGQPSTTDTALAISAVGDYVRDFDGTDDNHTSGIGTGADLDGATFGTWAALFRPDTVSGLRTFASLHDSGSTNLLQIYLDGANIGYWNGGSLVVSSSNPVATADRWYLVVIRKGSGTVAPRFSRYDFTADAWVHGNLGTIANHEAPTSGSYVDFSFGGAEPWNGKIACRAVWTDVVQWSADTTGDAAIEAAGLEVDWPHWLTQAPNHAWRYWQASATAVVTDEGTSTIKVHGDGVTGTAALGSIMPPGFTWEEAGGNVITLGQPETTDTPLTLTKAVVRTLGLPETTDEPLAVTKTRLIPVGQPETTDTAQALTRTVQRTLGLGETTDTALAITKITQTTIVLGLPETTDAALALTRTLTRTLGLPETTDEALALTRTLARSLGLAETADEALTLSRALVRLLGLPETTDAALSISKAVGWTIVLGQPETTDAALTVTKVVTRGLGLPAATDEALAVARAVARALGLPTTTDETQALTRTLSRALGQPETTDATLALAKAVTRTLGLPESTDVALAITKTSGATIILGLPTTTETPLAISKAIVRTLGLATVSEEPLALIRNVTRGLGLPTTTDVPLALTRTLARALGLPVTTDDPLAIVKLADRVIILGLPETFDLTSALTVVVLVERWTFSPPHRGAFVPDWIKGVSPRKAKTPFDHFTPTIERYPNVFLLTDDTLTEEQPPSWSQVAKVYYGGHTTVIEDQTEHDRLVAAGYVLEPV